MTQATYSQARRASADLADRLLKDFSAAAGGPVNGTGVNANGRIGYHVMVYLEREATKEEKKQLPDQHRGVPVRYEVIGTIKPQRG
jgi:hypothetical protein